MNEKECPRCHVVMPLTSEFFGSNKNEKYGFNSYCRKCWNAIQNERRQKERDAKGIVPIPDGMRKCSTCKQLLPATREYFSTQKMGKNGLQSFCKSCGAKQQKRYRNEHPDRIAIMERKRNQNPNRQEQHRLRNRLHPRNKEQHRKQNQERRRLLNNAEGFHTDDEIMELYELQDGRCGYCGIPIFWNVNRDIHEDHMTPLSRGGSDWIDNIVLACETCNCSKHDKTREEWIKYRGW